VEREMTRLHVNVDHVATLRQQRGTQYPDPVTAAALAELAGADGITVHLREDRRHIQPRDVELLRQTVQSILNLEMAATDQMISTALRIKPEVCTLVPEKRQEQTTEGGLDVVSGREHLAPGVAKLRGGGVRVSLFIDPEPAQVRSSKEVGAQMVELHTGDYCRQRGEDKERELDKLRAAARQARGLGLMVAAGHGLSYTDVGPVAAIAEVEELNIGHGLICRAVLVGLERAVHDMHRAIRSGEGSTQ
jgi:pyridoxine 5-phosphate synthase